ncbi:beta strand repeat-containing protein [Chitinophaga sp. Ak27]|uniref:beta strand repeat-containing protein n=1 Tax=Chitinophaga sp. Ak27 TaxID=2726116 RepID=UPI002006F01D|nr:hypothetical protein [Chitinophaga sp. Ak27]
MRSFFSIIFLLFIGTFCHAQHVYQIKADSVRIYNTCDTAELILENRTQKVPGFLFNKGNGRTEFQKLRFTSPGLGLLAIQGQDTINLSNVLSPWTDTRYDLLSTNFATLSATDTMRWEQWYTNKPIGYFAYSAPDMPVLSAQAFNGSGSNTYYNGLVVKTATTGFDFAVNWNGELQGPNGAFIRTKDDTQTKWSQWRELLFKDYADKAYVLNQKVAAQAANLWISGAAKVGDSVVLTRYKNNAAGDSVLTTDAAGNLKLKLMTVGGGSLQDVTTVGNRTSNEMLITGNALSNTDKGLHLSFNPVTNSSKIINVDVNGNPNTTLINMDLHNLEFFTQTGYRILGLNDQQSAGLAGANFNCRVRGESALLNNEFPILGQMIDSINAHTKDVAPGNIPLSTVLLNGSQANNNINLGASGQTTQYGLNVTRTIGGTDYKATYAINAAGSAYMGVASGTSTRVIDVPAALTYARYSLDGGNTYYQIWDANAHPAGNAVDPTLTGANVLSRLFVNSAGHITGAATRALLASDISAAPAAGSWNYIQNQETVAQSGASFWIAGGATAGTFRSTASIGLADLVIYNGRGIGQPNTRWTIHKSITETGTGNVGSNFNIARYADNGGQIDVPLSINRSTGEVTLGIINNEATDVDKFLVSNGGVLRYRTGAQTLLDIGAAPLSGAGNYIQNGTTAQTANFNITGNGTFGSMASFAGGIQLTNGTSNLINYSNFGVVAPTFTTRSAGTKLVYYSTLSTAAVDYATGVETSHIWNSVPINSNTVGFKWYGGTTPVARLDGLGSLELVGQGRFKGWYTANGTGPAAELGFSGGIAALYGFDRTAGAYTPLRLGGGNTATGRYFDIDGTGYKFTNLPNTKMLATDALGYVIDNSGAFIQNGTSVQASSNFNISGAGVIGTALNVGGQTTLNTVSVSGTTNMTGALTASGGISTTAIKMKEGTANATMGVASFGSGVISVTVNTTAVTANSRIFLTPVVTAASPIAGMTAPCLGPRVAGTSFTIFWTKEAVSSSGSVEWMIVEPY